MKFSAEILEELNKVSPLLAGIEKTNVFSVPEGYFDMLTIGILKNINTKVEIKSETLTVPEGYFENLSTNILNNIRSLNESPAQELRALSPMLYSIQNENVFQVPAGYFRNLENEILDKVIARPQSKVVEFKKRDSIWKYAVAAVVTGVIGLSSLMMFNTSRQSVISKENDASVSSSIKTTQQFKSEIATLSDDEIIKYLEATGSDVDNETLATSVDASKLPATNDYLLDENTLDTYLDETNKNSQN